MHRAKRSRPFLVRQALFNDTLFLSSINVMDYSLLVGMVQTSQGQARVNETAFELH